MSPEKLIMNYWRSWQGHSDWENTRRYMADNFRFDAGGFQTDSADALIELMKQGNPWEEVELLQLVMSGDTGTLVYEGTDSVTGERFRIAEVLTVEGGKITDCLATIGRLPSGDVKSESEK